MRAPASVYAESSLESVNLFLEISQNSIVRERAGPTVRMGRAYRDKGCRSAAVGPERGTIRGVSMPHLVIGQNGRGYKNASPEHVYGRTWRKRCLCTSQQD